jgi:hypothetical protein
MYKFTCPHCHKHSISIWQKLTLGVRSMSDCNECGARLSTPFVWALLSASPIFALVLLNRLGIVPRNNPWLDVCMVVLIPLLLHLLVTPIVAKTGNVEERV